MHANFAVTAGSSARITRSSGEAYVTYLVEGQGCGSETPSDPWLLQTSRNTSRIESQAVLVIRGRVLRNYGAKILDNSISLPGGIRHCALLSVHTHTDDVCLNGELTDRMS